MPHDSQIIEILDSMPGVIHNAREFITKVRPGDKFYLTYTFCKRPEGFSEYTLISLELEGYNYDAKTDTYNTNFYGFVTSPQRS